MLYLSKFVWVSCYFKIIAFYKLMHSRLHIRLYFLFIILLCFLYSSLDAQKIRKIDINADYIEFDDELGNDAKRLIGNVKFSHEGILMTCDSAWYFSEANTVDAYSNVHLWQGDTLDLYGDYLKYRGDVRFANVRRNVILIDKESKLTTEYIDYDFSKDLAYYLGGGKIINANNNLESKQGYYYSKEKLLFFKDSVTLINPDYTMYSDTLKYNTVSEVAYFLGPTDIVSDENYIYCENGWYDTRNNISQFNKNAFLQTEDKTLRGDSLYYERETGIGKAYYQVELIDTTENIILRGNYALYFEASDYAMLTDSALMIQIDNQDSLYIHADTLKSIPDTILDIRTIHAYYHVKIFRSDLQGKCDSLVYSDLDSAFRFFGEPVIWSDENQLTAELIEIFTKNQKIDHIKMNDGAFIISEEDSSHFNQIKGRNMIGYFKNGKLNYVDVNGNGETLYFVPEEEVLIGANKAESSSLKIYLEDNKISRINFLTQPKAIYYPIGLLLPNDAILKDFIWLKEYRPLRMEDVFRWKEYN